VMVFTFARISAACGLNVADIFHQQRRMWVRLHEKGGKFHEMPCHHTLEGYLAEYVERARLAEAGKVALFQHGAPAGPGGRHHHRSPQPHLPGHRHHGLPRERRHFREGAANGSASTRTTHLYDRREDRVTLDEVVKINIRG